MKPLAAPRVQATPVLMRQCGTQRMGALSRRLMKQTPDAIVEHVKRLLSESGFQASVARRSASQVLLSACSQYPRLTHFHPLGWDPVLGSVSNQT